MEIDRPEIRKSIALRISEQRKLYIATHIRVAANNIPPVIDAK